MARTEFERVAPESVGIKSEDIMELVNQLESGFTEMHGLMIMRHSKICCEGWWQPYAPGIVHGLQSLSKTYAATAVGIAYTEGLVALDEKIIDIFPQHAPENPSDNLKLLTVHHVLCMGCGMDDMPRPTKDWIRDFLHIPVAHKPGTTYMYNSVGSTLLGAVVREKTGMGLQEYLTPRLFDKIGIDAESLKWMYMPDGMEVGGGGLFAATEDNLRLMKLYADGGVWEGQRILAADYVEKAVTSQNASATEAKNNPDATDNFLGYGYQIWMCSPEKVYRADGAMGQFSIVFPNQDMIISINETASEAHWAQKTLDVIWEFARKVDADGTLPENKSGAEALAKHMNTRALPAPVFAPHSSESEALQGKWFTVRSGGFTFENTISKMLSGREMSGPVEKFTFRFEDGTCLFEFKQDDQIRVFEVAVDGTRRLNFVDFENNPCHKLYLNGYWSSPETFTIMARWVESCFEKRLDFKLAAADTVEVFADASAGGFKNIDVSEKATASV